MPRLWTDTIEGHRREVRSAILDTTAGLVAERGALSMTMSEIAQASGIGRATLYKYFPDIEAILAAWHERHVVDHLARLEALASGPEPIDYRLRSVLEAYAFVAKQRQGVGLAALLHGTEHVERAEHDLLGLLTALIEEGATTGWLRSDVAPRELATFCVHALEAAGTARSKAAVTRLVEVTLSALQR